MELALIKLINIFKANINHVHKLFLYGTVKSLKHRIVFGSIGS